MSVPALGVLGAVIVGNVIPLKAGVVAVPVVILGALKEFDDTSGLEVVPATAGHVSVAVPEVEP